MKTIATAVLSLFLTALAVTLAEGAWRTPDELVRLFLRVELIGAPPTLYLALFVRGWMVLRAQDRISQDALLAEAHLLGLASGGFCLALVLALTWIYTGFQEERVLAILPAAAAGAAAGGLGLAWGALWKLPGQEEAA